MSHLPTVGSLELVATWLNYECDGTDRKELATICLINIFLKNAQQKKIPSVFYGLPRLKGIVHLKLKVHPFTTHQYVSGGSSLFIVEPT